MSTKSVYEPRWNPGQKLMVVSEDHPHYSQGTIVTLKEIELDGGYWYIWLEVQCDYSKCEREGKCGGWNPDRFKAVKA